MKVKGSACDDSGERLPILIQTIADYSEEALLTANQLQSLSLDTSCDIYLSIDFAKDGFSAPPGIRLIERGAGKCWSSDLLKSLSLLNAEYVLFWLDDFVPLSVNEKELNALWQWIKAIKGNYIRLNPTPRGEGKVAREGVRLIEAGESYRASTILAIWNVELLRSLLVEGESAWQFEFYGSVRSDPHQGFFASEKFLVTFVNLVVKGYVLPSAEHRLIRNGINTGSVGRARMSSRQTLKFHLLSLRSAIFALLPTKIRRRLRLMFTTDLKLDNI